MLKERYTSECSDCGGECSRRAERCRSCREKFRWRNPDDPRRCPPPTLTPDDPGWPLCACGCGEPAPARKAGCTERGFIKGEPCSYVAGHSNRQRIKLPVDGELRCSKCERIQVVLAFNRDGSRPSGYDPWCRDCQRAEYQRRNPVSKYRRWPSAAIRARAYAAAYRARKRDQFVEDVDPFAVIERDGALCGICGDFVDLADFHIDHVIPLSRGGEHSYANVQLAHPSCNCQKHDKLMTELEAA